MLNREEFCRSVKEYLAIGDSTITELSGHMGYTRRYVSNMLHGHEKMSEKFIRIAIKALAKTGCIHERGEARTLLKLMDMLDFSPDEWALPPLVDLTETAFLQTGLHPASATAQQ